MDEKAPGESSQLNIVTIGVTAFAQNCRILSRDGSQSAVVVDPGGESSKIISKLESLKLTCTQIWLTHCHVDHCGGVAALKRATGATVVGPRGEDELRERVVDICQMYGLPLGDMENCPEPETLLSGGETIEIDGFAFKALPTPGHSPGHLSFYCEDTGILLAGDALFQGSIGRTDLPGGNHDQLIRSIREHLLTLPDTTRVLPGHGPDTTIGIERRTNPFLV